MLCPLENILLVADSNQAGKSVSDGCTQTTAAGGAQDPTARSSLSGQVSPVACPVGAGGGARQLAAAWVERERERHLVQERHGCFGVGRMHRCMRLLIKEHAHDS